MTADAWVLDLDGVMWLGDTAIDGSVAAVARLRDSGHRVGFCTNNSSRTIAYYVDKLRRLGIESAEVLSSAMAAATLVDPGESVLPCAGDGVIDALRRRGCAVLDRHDDQSSADAVIVGFHRNLDYDGLRAATRAVLGGARLIATNTDPLFPDETGWSPGGGAIVAAVERASGVTATCAGKPNEAMAAMIRSTFGDPGVFVGDTPETDGAMAERLAWPFGLVLTGNTRPDAAPPLRGPGWIATDLAGLVDEVEGDVVP